MKKRNHTLRGGAVRCALALTLAMGLVPVQAISAVAAAEEAAGQTEAAEQPEQIVSETVELSGAVSVAASASSEGDQAATDGAAADASASEGGADAAVAGAAGAGAQVAAPAAAQQMQSARVTSGAASAADIGEGNNADRAEVDIVSASVQLSSAATIVAQSGMSFLVDDAARTATLVCISNTALQGQLAVPAEVLAAGTAYTVTNISAKNAAGGGSELNPGDAAQAAEGSAQAEPTNVDAAASDAASGSIDPESAESVTAADAAEPTAQADAATRNPYATDLYAEADKAAGVTSIVLPATVESIDPAFFQLFPNAASIAVDAGNSAFTSYNGMLFGTNDAGDPTDLLLVPEGMEGAAVLPTSMATVPACVITRCNKLSAIVFPTGSTVSAHFISLNGILYSKNTTAEGEFDGTLTLLAAPAGLGASASIAADCTGIAAGAFWGNEGLKTIIAPTGIADIPVGAANTETENGDKAGAGADAPVAAFNQDTIENATVLTTDRAPWEAAGFTHFAKPAEPGEVLAPAPGDSGLTYTLMENGQLSVRWTGDAPASGERTIPRAATLHGVDYTVSTIEDGAFEGQEELTTINLPDTITAIGSSAFAGCTGLAGVHIPSSVATIDERAFAGSGIAAITLPTSVATVGSEAFAECTNLETLTVLGTVADVDPTVLVGCADVSVYVPYRADGAYAWSIGAPAAANHLMPYGVKVAANPIQLKLGEAEEADLFEGGYLEAPGDIEVATSYRSCVSVSDDRIVTAKQIGTIPVTVTLQLNGQTIAAATANVTVAPADKPATDVTEEESAEETIEEGEAADNEFKKASINLSEPFEEPSIESDIEGSSVVVSNNDAQTEDGKPILSRTYSLAANTSRSTITQCQGTGVLANGGSISIDKDNVGTKTADSSSWTINSDVLLLFDKKTTTSNFADKSSIDILDDTKKPAQKIATVMVNPPNGYQLKGWTVIWYGDSNASTAATSAAMNYNNQTHGLLSDSSITNGSVKSYNGDGKYPAYYHCANGTGTISSPQAVRWFCPIWEPMPSTIEFDYNGGVTSTTNAYPSGISSANMESTTVYRYHTASYGALTTLLGEPRNIKAGYHFLGWKVTAKYTDYRGSYNYVKGVGNGKFYSEWAPNSTQSFGHFKLTAVWRVDINLDANVPRKVGNGVDTILPTLLNLSYYSGYGYLYGSSATVGISSDGGRDYDSVAFLKTGDLIAKLPAHRGWIFAGFSQNTGSQLFYIDKEGKLTSSAMTRLHAANETWYASWKRTITIDYNNDSGTTDTFEVYCNQALSTVTVALMQKDNWTVLGVYTEKTGGQKVFNVSTSPVGASSILSAEPGTNESVLGDATTIYAAWQRTIVLDANGGTFTGISGTPSTYPITIKTNDTSTFADIDYRYLTVSQPTSAVSHTWRTEGFGNSATSKGTIYLTGGNSAPGKWSDAAKADPTSIPDTLYLVWVFTVNVNKQGGTGGSSSINVYRGGTVPNLTKAIPPSGHTLKGYYTTATGSTQTHNSNGVKSGNHTWGTIPNTIYAQYEGHKEFAVTYYVGGDLKYTDNEMCCTSVAVRSKYSEAGYNIGAWTTSDVTVSSGKYTMPAKPVRFDATKTGISSTITFSGNWPSGASGSLEHSATMTISYGEVMDAGAALMRIPVCAGYVFKGYYIDAAGSGTPCFTPGGAGDTVSSSYLVQRKSWDKTENTTLYAKWEPSTTTAYKIEYYYQAKNGTWPSKATYSTTKYDGTTGESKTISGTDVAVSNNAAHAEIPALTAGKERYVRNSNANGKKDVLTETIKRDGTTAFKVYYKIQFRVSYSVAAADSGKGSVDSNDIWRDYNAATGDAVSVKVKDGYIHSGWSPTHAVANAVTKAMEYVAQFGLVFYKVTLNTGGGTISAAGYTAETAGQKYSREFTVETATFELPIPQRPGYIFDGWKLNNTGTPSKSITITKGTTEHKNYTAAWTEDTVTLTFSADRGGTVAPAGAQAGIATVTGSKTSTATPSAGYAFDGWYDGTTKITATSGTVFVGGAGNRTLTVKGSASAPLQSKTYTAKFTPIDYTITLKLHGGGMKPTANTGLSGATISSTGDGTITYNIESAQFSVGKPVANNGYTFVGWYATDDADQAISAPGHAQGQVYDYVFTVPHGSAKTFTLHAIWRSEITLDANSPVVPNRGDERAQVDQKGYDKLYYYTKVGDAFGYHADGDLSGYDPTAAPDYSAKPVAFNTDFNKAITVPTIDPAGWTFSYYYADKGGSGMVNRDGSFTADATSGAHQVQPGEVWKASWSVKYISVTIHSNANGTPLLGLSNPKTETVKYEIAYGSTASLDVPIAHGIISGGNTFAPVGLWNRDSVTAEKAEEYYSIIEGSYIYPGETRFVTSEKHKAFDATQAIDLYLIYGAHYQTQHYWQAVGGGAVYSGHERDWDGYALTGEAIGHDYNEYTGFTKNEERSGIGKAVMPKPFANQYVVKDADGLIQHTIDNNSEFIVMAYYDRESYRLTFDANLGKYSEDKVTDMPSPSSSTIWWDEARPFGGVEPKRVGYAFKGWAFDQNATEPDFDADGKALKSIEGIGGKALAEGATYRHIFTEDRTLYALWSPTDFFIRLNKFTGEHESSLVTGTRFDNPFAFSDLQDDPVKVTLPTDLYEDTNMVDNQDPETGNFPGYFLLGWTWLKDWEDADGNTVPEEERWRYMLPIKTTMREIVLEKCGITDPAVREVHLYAVWQMAYHVDAPTDERVDLVLDVSNKDTYRASDITFTSTTPAPISVSARSQALQPAAEEVFSQTIGSETKTTDLQNVRFRFDMDGVADRDAPRFAMDAAAYERPVDIGTIAAAGTLSGQLSMYFNNKNEVYLNPKVSPSRVEGDDDAAGDRLDMNGTIWDDPVARIAWLVDLVDEKKPTTYTQFVDPPGDEQPGYGTVTAAAERAARPDD